MPDGRVKTVPLFSPAELRAEQPGTPLREETVAAARREVTAILDGDDDRLLVIAGPCSVHDYDATLLYARWLSALGRELSSDVLVVLRTYFEKPRTSLGWPGLLTDPWLDGGYALEDGIRVARSLLCEVADIGLAVACEWLAPMVPAYLADLVSWGAIGARTVASQTHRHLASGLPMPVGMKNTVDGDPGPAVEAVLVAAARHVYPGIGDRGRPVSVHTNGNPDAHVVLRGGRQANYSEADVLGTVDLLRAAGLPERVLVDASHGNSGKDHLRQYAVLSELANRIAAGEPYLRGVLIESFLEPGRQSVQPGRPLTFGRSITDACLDWHSTQRAIRGLAAAVRTRRERCGARESLGRRG